MRCIKVVEAHGIERSLQINGEEGNIVVADKHIASYLRRCLWLVLMLGFLALLNLNEHEREVSEAAQLLLLQHTEMRFCGTRNNLEG